MRYKKKTVWAYLDGEKLVDVVQAALQNPHQVFAGHAGLAGGFLKVAPELPLQHAIVAAGGLLGPQLQAVLGDFFIPSLGISL